MIPDFDVPPGTVLSRYVLPVDSSKAREAALALKTTDPDWLTLDPQTLAGKVVPPTFSTTSSFSWGRREVFEEALGMDFGRGLHGSSTWEFERPVVVGDELHGELTFQGLEQKKGQRGGDMRLFHVSCSFRDPSEALVLTERFTFIETSGWPAAEAATRSAEPEEVVALRAGLVGDDRIYGPVTRTDIVRYAGACGDFSEIHHDEELARASGLPTVFAMGLFQGGLIGLHATETQPGRELKNLSFRLVGRVWPDDHLVLASRDKADNRSELEVSTLTGRTVIRGEALFKG